jgi:hypothetical protein
VFIIVLATTAGQVCESYATYAEAKRRVDQFPAESLVGVPFIFQELPDGSQRLVREDGKPLQWHRVPEAEDLPAGPEEPIPLSEADPGLCVRPVEPMPMDPWQEEDVGNTPGGAPEA